MSLLVLSTHQHLGGLKYNIGTISAGSRRNICGIPRSSSLAFVVGSTRKWRGDLSCDAENARRPESEITWFNKWCTVCP
jgi:hypothetical protein